MNPPVSTPIPTFDVARQALQDLYDSSRQANLPAAHHERMLVAAQAIMSFLNTTQKGPDNVEITDTVAGGCDRVPEVAPD